MREVFGTKMEAGSEIVIAVKKPNQKEQMVHLVVNKDDQKFLKSLEDLL
jgi:hypothetical protein